MITPSVYQLEFIVSQVPGLGRSVAIGESWLNEIEMSMRRDASPLVIGFTPEELATACIAGFSAASKMASSYDTSTVRLFAEAIFWWTLPRNGYDYGGDEEPLEKAFNRLQANPEEYLLNDTSRRQASTWLAENLVALTRSDPRAQPYRGLGLRAYVCSALTDLDAAGQRRVFQVSDAIDAALEDRGIWTHIPVRYTNPNSDPDAPKEEIHHFDCSLVLNSDLLVAYLDWPTTGGGKELAWAERAGVPVLVVTTKGKRVSKLVLGATGSLLHGDLGDFSGLVESLMPSVLARQGRRLANDATYGPLGSSVMSVGDAIDGRRLAELQSSAQHLASASLWEADVALRDGGHDGRLRELDGREIAALATYARGKGLSTAQAVVLAQKGQSYLPSNDKHRATLRDPRDWEAVDQ